MLALIRKVGLFMSLNFWNEFDRKIGLQRFKNKFKSYTQG